MDLPSCAISGFASLVGFICLMFDVCWSFLGLCGFGIIYIVLMSDLLLLRFSWFDGFAGFWVF